MERRTERETRWTRKENTSVKWRDLDIRKWESIVEAVEKWTPGGDAPFPTPESEDALTELKRHTSTTRFQVYGTFSHSEFHT